jgi:glycosyltransferase involved in cell wall biosynthesis
MSCEVRLFGKTTIISHSLANLLRIDSYILLPLGTIDFGARNHLNYSEIRLVYVGTLSLRRLEDTIVGVKKYLQHNQGMLLTYDIIGDGNGDELKHLKIFIKNLGLCGVITCHGRIPNTKVKKYLHQANVGVSYVPLTPFYHVQPVTKTLEYLSTGMPVLGTKTYEQCLVINDPKLGQLCEDNPDSFSEALEEIARNLNQYDPDFISNAVKGSYWPEICLNLDNNIFDNLPT